MDQKSALEFPLQRIYRLQTSHRPVGASPQSHARWGGGGLIDHGKTVIFCIYFGEIAIVGGHIPHLPAGFYHDHEGDRAQMK